MDERPLETPITLASALNDRDLLRRFVQDADECAFAEIVRRYQGLVMGVCRRVIGNGPDVDDAFQATFIVLARRPGHVRHAVALSSWLYTVAWRTSLRMIRQRRKHPVELLTDHAQESEPDPLDQIASAQDCLVLDEELNALPEKYRAVLVMTYFAGLGSQQIADQLNVSKGTIDGRIRQARNILRVRLARRGVAISAMAVAVGLCSGPSAAAAPAVLEATIQLGAQTLNGSLPGTTDLSHLDPFIRSGVAGASHGYVKHFYDAATQQMMARLELEYRGRPAQQILKTLFRVRPAGDSFELYVADQVLR
jgi:RNA polymerase sigma factor (sigma-70 family)